VEIEDSIDYPSSANPARVRVEVGQRVLLGDVYLGELAFRSRVSDVLNDPERRFLPMANVSAIDPNTGQVKGTVPFLLVRIEAMDVVIPIEEPGERPDLG
jgi:hypothetical protein